MSTYLSKSRVVRLLSLLIPLGLALPACTSDNPQAVADASDTDSACTSTACMGGDASIANPNPDMTPFCGNAVIDPGEQCDDGPGKNTIGSGCEPSCQFTCIPGVSGDARCTDGDPCNGTETCTMDHKCIKGTALADNASCGMAKVCNKMVCSDISCGDGLVSGTEECDNGMNVAGSGCEPNCSFTCLSTDNNRNCTGGDPCKGVSACNDMTHTCSPPAMPLADNAQCGPTVSSYCKMGVCTMAVCDNGVLEPGEQCDDNNKIEGDGCDNTCVFSCANPLTDCKQTLPACEKWTCNMSHVCLAAADATLDGKSCGMNLVCKTGACVGANATCGNGVVEFGEDCDFGGGNGAGVGCESNCKFSCTKAPDSCVVANSCVAHTCTAVMVNGHAGQNCQSGMTLPDGSACGAGNICLMGTCKLSSCGDGFIDLGGGETCEPPNTAVCDAMCHKIVVASCGDGMRQAGEDCDDGNTANLDGCSATCKFEQVQRIDYFKAQFGTDAYCTKNQLGAAFVAQVGQQQLQTALDNSVKSGGISILFQFFGLVDLLGGNSPMVTLGVFDAKPVAAPGGVTYDGSMVATDTDWWYTANVMALDMKRVPTATVAGAISGKVFNGTSTSLTLELSIGGAPQPVHMSNAKMTASIGAVSTPKTSMGNTPGHLAKENLDPTLQSFVTTAQQNANGAGKLCGNVSASSLSMIVLPTSVGSMCGYSANASILDALVGGCTILGFLQIVKATQPDQTDPVAPAAGMGPPYTLIETNKAVTSCKDKSGAVVPLATCLSAAAYSASFQFATNRVIAK